MPETKDFLSSFAPSNNTSIKDKGDFLSSFNPSEKSLSADFKSIEGEFKLDSQYDNTLRQGMNQEENRAQQQTRLDRVANAVPRLISKIGTEVLKTPAYLYAVGESLGDKTLAETLDNAWLNALQNFDDKTKEKFAVYTPKSVKDGNIWNSLSSTSFYTNEGVDGLGFLVAMLAPGAVLKSAGIAAKAAKLGASASLANNIELGSMTVMNTVLESAAETKGLVDSLKPELELKVQLSEINTKTGKPWTSEDIETTLGEVGRSTMFSNMALLLGPNFLMNKNLLGRFTPTKNTINKTVDATGKFVDVSKLTKKEIASEYAKKIGSGLFSEGFVEEAGQFAIEDYHKKLGKGNTKEGLVSGILDSYAEALTSTEGQKSIFLGGLFGSTAALGGIKQLKAEKEYASKLSNILKNNFEGFSTSIDDIYQKDDKGKVILEKDNHPKLNLKKVQEAVYNIALENKASHIKDIYALNNNKEAFDYISDNEFTRFAFPYLQEEGGLEVLNKHIDLLSNKLVENKKASEGVDDTFNEAQYRNELKQKAKKLQDTYNSVDNLINTIDISVDKQAQPVLDQFLGKLKNAAFQETSKQFYLNDRISKLSSEILNLEMGSASALPQIKSDITKSKDQVSKYQKALKESIDNYELIFDKKEQEKAFSDFFKGDKIKDEAIVEAEKKEEKKPTPDKPAPKPTETDKPIETTAEVTPITTESISDKIVKGEKLSTEEEQFRQNNSEEVENNLTNIKNKALEEEKAKKDKTVRTAQDNVLNEADSLESQHINALFDLQHKLTLFWNKTTGGMDNDVKPAEYRYFRFLDPQNNNIKAGTQLLIVTRTNNTPLFEELLAQDPTGAKFEKDYEASTGSKYEGIYVVFVDSEGNHILSNQDGRIDPNGKAVFSTILDVTGVDNTAIKDKPLAKEELSKFRTILLEIENPKATLNGLNTSGGILAREKFANGQRRSSPVLGRITTDIKTVDPVAPLLQLPIVVFGDNETTLRNDQSATAGKLYAFDENNLGIDLIPRKVNEKEARTIVALILQRFGIKKFTDTKASDELDKLIYFGVPSKDLKSYTLGVEGNMLYVGDLYKWTAKELEDTDNQAILHNFLLAHKNVNANSQLLKENNESLTEFQEPFLSDSNTIEYRIWSSYQEYLLSAEGGREPFFGTDMPMIGRPRFRNFYVTFNPKVIGNEISLVDTEVFVEPTNSTEINIERDANGEIIIAHAPKVKGKHEETNQSEDLSGESYDRLKSALKGELKELSKEEIEWFKDQFPDIEIKDIIGLIDNKSFGRFLSSGKVLLSDLAPGNTLRHEAFHVVTQLYLTKKEIKALYTEARNRLKNKKLTDREVEEELAEDFANYGDTGKVLGDRPLTRNIFQRLLDGIRKLLRLSPTNIKDIYEKLETGQFKGKTLVNNRQFIALDKSLPNRSVEFTKDALDGLDFDFFDVLFTNGFTPDKLFTSTKLSTKLYETSRNRLVRKLKLAEENGNDKLAQDYDYILDNWSTKGGVVELHMLRLKSLGINMIKGTNEKTGESLPGYVSIYDINLSADQSVVADENVGGKIANEFDNANLVSTKDIMYKQTKLLVRTLPKVDAKGELILNNLGLPVLIDFNSTYNFLLKNLSGVSDYPSMILKLGELSNNKPELNVLINRLGGTGTALSVDQIKLQNQFRQDFDKNQASGFKTIIKLDGTVYAIDATREFTSGKVKDIWRNALAVTPGIHIDSEGRLNTTVENLLSPDRKKLPNIEFLVKLGITFSNETLPFLANNAEFSDAVNGIKQHVFELLTRKKAKEEAIANKRNPDLLTNLSLNNLFSELSDSLGNMNVLADLEAKYTPNVTELSYLSTKGKTVYSISLNNALSIIKNIVNNSKTKAELFSKLPHLDTVYTKNSVWLKQMFDANGNKRHNTNINLDLFDGISTQDVEVEKAKPGEKQKEAFEKSSQQTSELVKGDKYIQDLNNLLLEGKTAVIRTSDKSNEYSASLSNYGGKKFLPVQTELLASSNNIKEVKEIFRGYFKDELQSIFESAINGLGKNVDIYRNITEWNKDKTKVDIKWRIFHEFPSNQLFKDRTKETIEKIVTLDISLTEKQAIIDELYNELIPAIDKSTVDFFDDYTIELINEYKENGVFERSKYNPETGETTKGTPGISKDLLAKYSHEQIFRSLAVNDLINSVEQVKLFIGDMASYKDLFKRTSAFSGTKKTVRVDNAWHEWLNINRPRFDGKKANGKLSAWVFEDSVQRSAYFNEYVQALLEDKNITKEKAEEILSAYAKMDEADAQGHITLDEYREFFDGVGDWLPQHEAQYQYEINLHNKALGKDFNQEILDKGNPGFYFMPIKAQYAGPQATEGLYAPAFHKYSLMPLQYSLVKGRNLEVLLDNMNANQIGYSVFKSGSKVGTIVDEKTGETNRFYKESQRIEGEEYIGTQGEINTETPYTQVLDYRFLGIQLDIAPKLKEEVVFGTQFRKILFGNLFTDGVENFPGAKALFDEYSKIFEDLISDEKDKLFEELGIDPKTFEVKDVRNLVELLRKEAQGRNLSENIIESLQTEEINGKFLLKYSFDSMVNKDKVDSMIMSLVNARLIRQMMNGDAMIQGASTGFEPKGRRVKGDSGLLFYRKDTDHNSKTFGQTLPMQIKVPLTGEFEEILLAEYGTIEEVNKALKAGLIDKNFITLVGYRIPTQWLNSIDMMEIEEFLPKSSGNLIVLPTAVVAKSGGDYDIDKMNIFRSWYKPDSKTKVRQNRIISIAREVLSNKYNFNSLVTPNSTKILTNIVDELRYIEYVDRKKEKNLKLVSEGKKEEGIQSPSDYLSTFKKNLKQTKYTSQLKLTTKVDQFVKFLGGKSGVGIGALQNTHHVLAQIANLTLNDYYIDSTGKKQPVIIYFKHNSTDKGISLSKLKDIAGNNNISEVISQVINASVDIAKDPFMFDLNMNAETLATYLYLVRTGIEFEQIAYFMKQPIITSFLEEQAKNKSIFLKASKNVKSVFKINQDLNKLYESKIRKHPDFIKLKLSSEEFDQYMIDKTNRFDISKGELKTYLSKTHQGSLNFLHAQIQLLRNYREYKVQAGLLSEAIGSVNHDTAGLGQNLNAARNKIEQKIRVFKTRFVNNIDKVYKDTFIGSFDSHQLVIDMFSDFYNTQKKDIVKNNELLLKDLNGDFASQYDRNKLATLIENDLINYVVQNYGFEGKIDSVVKDLFTGMNDVARELLKLKTNKNLTGDDLILSKNLLIRELYPILKSLNKKSNHTETDNIRLYSKKIDTFTTDQLTEAFREIKDKNPKLANDLMNLGILQSGLNNSAITYMGVIPFEYYGELVKYAFEEFHAQDGVKDLYKFNQLFIRNNTKDVNVAKVAKDSGLAEDKTKLGYGMYLKKYDINLYDPNLYNVQEKQDPIVLENKPEQKEYTSDIIDNSEESAINTEKSVEVKPVNKEFKPANKEQSEAIDKIQDFISNDKSGEFFILEGKAGTGKTTIMSEALKPFFLKGKRIIISALSHKAKMVLSDKIRDAFPNFKFKSHTIASMLGMSMDNETGEFKANWDRGSYTEIPITEADIVVVDEASMVNKEALELIMDQASGAKVVFLGDRGQLPPIEKDGSQEISKVFNGENKASLTERVRQGEESPILPYADYFWDNSNSKNVVQNPVPQENEVDKVTKEGSLVFVNNIKDIISKVINEFRVGIESNNPNNIKVVTYRNATRSGLNSEIRKGVFGELAKNQFVEKEQIIFTNNYKISRDESIDNSSEFQVKKVTKGVSGGWNVFSLELPFIDENGKEAQFTVDTIANEDKLKLSTEIERLRQIAMNTPKKTQEYKRAWGAYYNLKDKFAPIDYGYAITSHKSQGSTYNTVIVDSVDIMGVTKISNKQKSQSIYTALTRAKNTTIVINGRNKTDLTNVSVALMYGDKEWMDKQESVKPMVKAEESIKPKLNLVERFNGIIKRSDVKNNPRTLYLFGDNDIRKGLGGQAKEMRGEPNTVGVSTKKIPSNNPGSFKTDLELVKNKEIITQDINNAIKEWNTGKYNQLIIPQIGVGLADLPNRAPLTWKFLNEEFNRLEAYINSNNSNDYTKNLDKSDESGNFVEDKKPQPILIQDTIKQTLKDSKFLMYSKNNDYFIVKQQFLGDARKLKSELNTNGVIITEETRGNKKIFILKDQTTINFTKEEDLNIPNNYVVDNKTILDEMKSDIADRYSLNIITIEERDNYLQELAEVDSNKKYGILKNKIC